jgi:flagellar basal-body rod protein FlgB
MKLFESTRIPFLGKALDAYALRNKVIAGNLANIETPGYVAKEVSFEQQLAGAMNGSSITMAKTSEHHLGPSAPGLPDASVVNPSPAGDPLASGVNGVDLDNEMAELAKNQIRFRFAAKLLGEQFRGLQKSIRGSQ